MPEDLKLAVKEFVQYIYQKRGEETFGITEFSEGDVSATFQAEMPIEVRKVLTFYKRILV